MLEELIYKNHRNEELLFGKKNIFANENDLHDFAWSITSKSNKITDCNQDNSCDYSMRLRDGWHSNQKCHV